MRESVDDLISELIGYESTNGVLRTWSGTIALLDDHFFQIRRVANNLHFQKLTANNVSYIRLQSQLWDLTYRHLCFVLYRETFQRAHVQAL